MIFVIIISTTAAVARVSASSSLSPLCVCTKMVDTAAVVCLQFSMVWAAVDIAHSAAAAGDLTERAWSTLTRECPSQNLNGYYLQTRYNMTHGHISTCMNTRYIFQRANVQLTEFEFKSYAKVKLICLNDFFCVCWCLYPTTVVLKLQVVDHLSDGSTKLIVGICTVDN